MKLIVSPKKSPTLMANSKKWKTKESLKQANELRDRRDELEYNLQTLVGANVFKNHLDSNASIHPKLADFDDEYVLNIGFGFNIVDGAMYHPIVLKKDITISI